MVGVMDGIEDDFGQARLELRAFALYLNRHQGRAVQVEQFLSVGAPLWLHAAIG
jgi:hypothetical protein